MRWFGLLWQRTFTKQWTTTEHDNQQSNTKHSIILDTQTKDCVQRTTVISMMLSVCMPVCIVCVCLFICLCIPWRICCWWILNSGLAVCGWIFVSSTLFLNKNKPTVCFSLHAVCLFSSVWIFCCVLLCNTYASKTTSHYILINRFLYSFCSTSTTEKN